MGNRSKYVVGAAVAGGTAVAIRRRSRLHAATQGIKDAILPMHDDGGLPADLGTGPDVAHAPGHAHLPPPPRARAPRPLLGRPWRKNAHGHPPADR